MRKQKRKYGIIQVLRLFMQILFFILIPGLYISAFGGVKQFFISVYTKEFDIEVFLPQLVSIVAVIPITLLVGRFFCGWMCAFGALGDVLYLFSERIFNKKLEVNEKLDHIFKYAKYIVLVVLIVVGWMMGKDTFQNANPWDAFGMLFTVGKVPDLSYVINYLAPSFIILVIIMFLSLFVERFFCRYLCPLGAIFAIFSKFRSTTIIKPKEQCGNCKICTSNCPMGISLYKEDANKSTECIQCFQCVSTCPKENVSFGIIDNKVRPMVASVMVVLVITGVYYGGVYVADNMETTSTGSIIVEPEIEKLYEDGTFEGSGIGYRGQTTTVSVTVENGLISSVELISTGDDREFIEIAYPIVVEAIIEDQVSDVDAVSGATYSSNGIMEAVDNAISQHRLSK